MVLSGCFAPGAESDDQGLPYPVSYRFELPDRELPAIARLSDADVAGMTLADSEFDLEAGPSRVQIRFQSTELRPNGRPSGVYCLEDDILIEDGITGEESIGVPAGSCFKTTWTHPEVE